MSDTPRTNNMCFSATTERPESGDYELEVIYADDARQLERELAATKSEHLQALTVIEKMREAIAALLDTELAELSCIGSDAPIEDALGKLQAVVLCFPALVALREHDAEVLEAIADELRRLAAAKRSGT